MWHFNRKKELKSNTKSTKINAEIKEQPMANNDGEVKLHETISEMGRRGLMGRSE